MLWQAKIRWAVAYGMAAFSAASAATYGAEQASTAWKAVLSGGGLFLCAFVAVHCMAWAAQAWRRPARAWAFVIGLGGSVCFVVTLAMSTGMWASRADKIIAGNAAAIDSGKDLRAERDRLTAERVRLSKRPADAVAADIETAKAHPRFRSTKGCVADDITAKESREHCAVFRQLEAELAGARRVVAIDARLSAIGAKLEALPAVKSADAQADTFGALLGVSPDRVASLVAFGTSLALELGALIATLAAEVLGREPRATQLRRVPRGRVRMMHHAARRQAVPAVAAPAPAAERALLAPTEQVVVQFPVPAERPKRLGGARVCRVEQYLLAAIDAELGAQLDAQDVLAGYKAFAAKRNMVAMPDDEFALALARACQAAGVECRERGNTIVLVNAKLVA